MSKTIILTGSTGTIGKELLKHLNRNNYQIIPWNRNEVSVYDYHQMETFIAGHKPDALIHLAAITSFHSEDKHEAWAINYEWPSQLAWICNIHQVRFIFTSTAMVFGFHQQGPFYPDSIPDAQEGYGFEKSKAEVRVLYQNPDSVILRLGWQIAESGTNSMICSLEREMKEKGAVMATSNWFPSSSFLQDTLEVIEQSIRFDPGIYQVNSNSEWSYFQIVSALKKQLIKDWIIQKPEDFHRDQRMMDERIAIPLLSFHLDFDNFDPE